MGEAHERKIAVTLQKEIYLLKLPAVRHGRHHLCQLLLLALQHPVHMLHRDLRERTNMREMGRKGRNNKNHKNVTLMEKSKLHRNSYTCDVLQSRSLILSLMSFINDVML